MMARSREIDRKDAPLALTAMTSQSLALNNRVMTRDSPSDNLPSPLALPLPLSGIDHHPGTALTATLSISIAGYFLRPQTREASRNVRARKYDRIDQMAKFPGSVEMAWRGHDGALHAVRVPASRTINR